MIEQQLGSSMEETAKSLATVLSDIEEYARHYGQYMDLTDSAIHFKWQAKPMIAILKRLAELAKAGKLKYRDRPYWEMED